MVIVFEDLKIFCAKPLLFHFFFLLEEDFFKADSTTFLEVVRPSLPKLVLNLQFVAFNPINFPKT